METKAPSEWFRLAAHLQQEKGVAILLGATDTGKSTLAKFLISELCPKGLTIGLVDADIGQSFLGPPATIGMSLFKSDPKWGILMSSPELFFVGSTTPEGHLMIHLKGVKKMLDKAIACGPDVILIDTTGFVSGEGGRELKRKKIDLTSVHPRSATKRRDRAHLRVLSGEPAPSCLAPPRVRACET